MSETKETVPAVAQPQTPPPGAQPQGPAPKAAAAAPPQTVLFDPKFVKLAEQCANNHADIKETIDRIRTIEENVRSGKVTPERAIGDQLLPVLRSSFGMLAIKFESMAQSLDKLVVAVQSGMGEDPIEMSVREIDALIAGIEATLAMREYISTLGLRQQAEAKTALDSVGAVLDALKTFRSEGKEGRVPFLSDRELELMDVVVTIGFDMLEAEMDPAKKNPRGEALESAAEILDDILGDDDEDEEDD